MKEAVTVKVPGFKQGRIPPANSSVVPCKIGFIVDQYGKAEIVELLVEASRVAFLRKVVKGLWDAWEI